MPLEQPHPQAKRRCGDGFHSKLGMRIPYFMPPYGLFRTTGRVWHLEMLTADRSAA